jgi:hypothetical protein
MRSFNNSKQNIATKQRVVGNQCALINEEYFLKLGMSNLSLKIEKVIICNPNVF